jgi:hypothetical protein
MARDLPIRTHSRDLPAMRLAALSNDRLNPWISWSALAPPLLKALTSRNDTVFASPPALVDRPRVPRSSCDAGCQHGILLQECTTRTAIWLAGSLPYARRTAFVLDAWQPQLSKIGRLAVMHRLTLASSRTAKPARSSMRFPQGRFE